MLADTLCSDRFEKSHAACDARFLPSAGGVRACAVAGSAADDPARRIDAAAQNLADAIVDALPGAAHGPLAAFVRILSGSAGLKRL